MRNESNTTAAGISELLFLDVPGFFDAFPEIKAGRLAAAAGINENLMYQYRMEAAPLSAARKQEIEKAIHGLARNLLRVRIR